MSWQRTLMALGCVLLLVQCARTQDETQPEGLNCMAQKKRSVCESSDACVWAEMDGEGRCYPAPDDCRITGCDNGLTCAPAIMRCLEPCPFEARDCCFPWHRCQDVGPPLNEGSGRRNAL